MIALRPNSAAAAWALLIATGASGALAEELNVEGEITSFLVRDQDGDGLEEIWAAYQSGGQRFIGVFRGAATYSKLPDVVVPVDPQAVLFAVGDYDPAPGLELLFLSRGSGVLYPLAPDKRADGIKKLFDTDLFFTMPSRKHTPAWLSSSKLDLDLDGIEDLVVPEKRRLRLFLSSAKSPATENGPAAPWRASISLPISYYLLSDTREEKVSRVIEDFAEEDKTPAPMLEATGAFPFPMFLDFDGDGRLDVIVKQPGYRIDVFRQLSPGAFSENADPRIQVPWSKDSSSILLADLNGDRKLDAVATRLLLKDLATEVKVFLQDPAQPGLGFAEPRQILKVQGFFHQPVLADADGDAHLDLLVATYRVDLLDQVKKSVVDEVELMHEVFAGGGETPFERRPSFQQKFLLRTQDLESKRSRYPLYVGHDLTGDGLPDILFVDGGRSLRLHRALSRKPLQYEEASSFSEKVEDPLEVRTANLDGRGGEEAILRYERRLEIKRVSVK